MTWRYRNLNLLLLFIIVMIMMIIMMMMMSIIIIIGLNHSIFTRVKVRKIQDQNANVVTASLPVVLK